MNGDVGGQNDLNQLNPANIERIEIVKGVLLHFMAVTQ